VSLLLSLLPTSFIAVIDVKLVDDQYNYVQVTHPHSTSHRDFLRRYFLYLLLNELLQVPTFHPDEKARQMNAVASFLGDERAAKARAKWGRPLKAVVITGGGVL